MSDKIKSPFSPKFVLLDIGGMFFLGIGLAKQFANLEFFPQLDSLGNYAPGFMAIGVVLMALAVRQLILNLKLGQ